MAPPRGRYLVFGAPRLPEEAIQAAVEVLRSGWLGTGPRVAAFEKAFSRYIGAPFAVAVGSCTAALHLALRLAEVGPGDEVITTPLTFAATANVIVHVGGAPRFRGCGSSHRQSGSRGSPRGYHPSDKGDPGCPLCRPPL